MKARHLVLTVFALILALPWLPADAPSVKPLDKPIAKAAVIPFELLKSGHIAVKIRVNGKGPYRVIFDTGAPVNLLNNKLAKEAGLLEGAAKTALPFVGTVAEVKVKELQLGPEKASNQPAIVMDHPTVELMAKKLGPLYGIVGFPFFARYKMVLDYQAQTMTLTPSGYKPGNPISSMAMAMQLLNAGRQPAKVLSPAAQWGLRVHKAAGDDKDGVDVGEVFAGSAAAAAGLKVGDRLLTIDGRWTDSTADVHDIAAHIRPGVRVPVVIRRDGKEMRLTVQPRPGM